MSFTRPNRTGKATANDKVMTPTATGSIIVDYFNPAGVVLEPCRGTGNIYNILVGRKGVTSVPYCEIDEGLDFFDFTDHVDWIVTNPPFSIFDAFLLHSFEVADNVVFFCPLNKVFKSMKIDRAIQSYGGIKEVLHMGTGSQHGFPFGFPVGCIHYARGYIGGIKYTRIYDKGTI